MSEEIQRELFVCLVCASTGVLLSFGYDLLRAWRRVAAHGSFLVAIEDFVYWSCAGIVSFGVIFLENSGAVRGFSLCAILAGMLLYYRSASNILLKSETWILRQITAISTKMLGIFWRPMSFFVKKICEKPKKALKNRIKEVKMTLFEKRGRN